MFRSTIVALCLAACVASAAPNAAFGDEADDNGGHSLHRIPLRADRRDNLVRSNLLADLERDSPSTNLRPIHTHELESVDNNDKESDKIKSIAFNSREVRLVGPEQKEIEMKDDVPTKIMIVLDNLQKEATDVWGQVNERLDKGWTELKTMVESSIAKPKSDDSQVKQQQSIGRQLREAPGSSTGKSSLASLVVVSDVDGYSMADDDSSLSKTAESAGAKIKGFFSNIGLNEDNQKKASEALSKAGTSVSDTVTKDLPDALKKAGDVVSETVTKDIPNAFKNFFG